MTRTFTRSKVKGAAVKPEDISTCRALAERFIVAQGGGSIADSLGDGGSAVVFHWNKNGESLALKVYDPRFFLNAEAAQAERHRLDLQRRLIGHRCQSMIETIGVVEQFDTCFVLMEFFSGIELKKVIGKVPDEAVPNLIRQLVDAVLFLEKHNLVHRDIKPENILVSPNFEQLRLLDLGVVREISRDEDRADGTDHGEKRPFIATAQYSSPEYLFRLEQPSPILWRALTIYQVGAVLHDLVCKSPLFEKAVAADNKYALAMSVMKDRPDFSGASPSMSHWNALAARCLTKDSALRVQTVDWPDFCGHGESSRDKLRKALAVRAETASRAELNEAQNRDLRRLRKNALSGLADAVTKQLISEFSPQLRVANLGCNEARACLFLIIGDVDLGVKLAIECSWHTGLRERIAAIRLAAQATPEKPWAEFSGERHAIGEMGVDGDPPKELLDSIIDAISDVVVKHEELVETDGVSDGTDLIATTWPA